MGENTPFCRQSRKKGAGPTGGSRQGCCFTNFEEEFPTDKNKANAMIVSTDMIVHKRP